MKTDSARQATRLLTLLLLVSALASCKLPPRYAMREIQSKGLFSYLGTDYSSGYSYGGGAYASAAPFQLQRPYTEPRPVNPIPYRSTYQTNRNLKADYDRVPYRPKTVTRSSPSYSPPSRARKSSPVIVEEETPTPRSSVSRPPMRATPDKVVTETPKSNTVTPAPTPPPAVEENLPFGTPVAGRPGMVVSPYTDPSKKQLVDVTGLPSGEKVKDPYSGKLFRVPPTQQADNKVKDSTPEAPAKPEADADKAKPKQ